MESFLRKDQEKLGVFVCHCGRNIAATVDTKRVVEEILKHPAVVHAEDYDYVCSDPGQALIEKAIMEKRLTGVVVAACSPSLHETTFRETVKRAGLNTYKCEIANIREQDSWVHEDREKATEKAVKLTKSAVEKVIRNEALRPVKVGLYKKALVIGGGIAGIRAALDIADAGFPVVLVERKPTIGGHMAQLAETFPTLDCASCILTPLMSAVAHHPNIKVLTLSEIVDVEGYLGNFHVCIKKHPRYVEPDKCNLCNECGNVCPVAVSSEFDEGLSLRKAIYIPFPQAVPSSYVIDINACLGTSPLICGKCAEPEVCGPQAVNFDDQEEIIKENFGVIIVATGYELYNPTNLGEYGADVYPDVITSLQFERLLSPSGPTGGIPKRPSDEEIPKKIAFIHCAGSRDERHQPYCSHICCTYSAKHALLFKELVPDAEIHSFYIDIRAVGKNYEDFIRRVQEETGIHYTRGKVSRIYEQNGKVKIFGVDTLLDKRIELEVDMAVLALPMVPVPDIQDLASKMRIQIDGNNFLQELHPKLHPVESATSGIFLAGVAQSPKDIQDTVAQASACASKALGILTQEKISHIPTVATVDEEDCSGCSFCISVCPYGAIKLVDGKALVEEVLCEGCGICVSTCPSGVIDLRNHTDEQVSFMIRALAGEI
ncbi:MAG: CoB--CoM heterodisulfide reductase iron-sulfur subunit A family protein [Candidatus Bathyarchaeota archaeon]|nr:CoB--CoM heterodisulfide reductase iron-sulfur subunit A family protein [Candidatus Bathyarchaeota archaeon]